MSFIQPKTGSLLGPSSGSRAAPTRSLGSRGRQTRVQTLPPPRPAPRGASEEGAGEGPGLLGDKRAWPEAKCMGSPLLSEQITTHTWGHQTMRVSSLPVGQPEVSDGSPWAQPRCWQGRLHPGILKGENLFLCLFKLLETTCVPRLTGFFLHPHGQPPG